MDDGKGNLVPLDVEGKTKPEISKEMKRMQNRHPKHGGWFRLDEEVIVKGSRFRVKKIKPTEITLKLLKRKE